MLLLCFRVAQDAYAVNARHVVEVVPRVDLRAVPHAPPFLAGLFHYRGQVVPVVDLGLLMGAAACRDSLTTRVMLVDYSLGTQRRALLGLMAEQVDDVRKVADEQLVFPAMHMPEAPYLGPILEEDRGLVQLIAVEHVLPEALRDGLFGVLAEGA
jgi:chemotaxis-related protein WspB